MGTLRACSRLTAPRFSTAVANAAMDTRTNPGSVISAEYD